MILDAEIEAWADRQASKLDPFTPEEAAVVGRIATELSARRIRRADEPRPLALAS